MAGVLPLLRRGRRSGQRRGLRPADRAASRRREPRLLAGPQPAPGRAAADLDLRPQFLPPRPARPLHRRQPRRGALLRRRPAPAPDGALDRGAAPLLRDQLAPLVRQAGWCAGRRPTACRSTASASRRRSTRRWPAAATCATCCARASSGWPAASPRRQLLRLAGLRPLLCRRGEPARCRPICGASISMPCAAAPTASR